MAECIQTSAADFYIDILTEAATKGSVPPAFQFSKPDIPDISDDTEVMVYAVVGKFQDKITKVSFFCSTKRAKKAKYFGTLKYKEYLDLEEELDTAVAEYRRKFFKKISHQQRHREENAHG